MTPYDNKGDNPTRRSNHYKYLCTQCGSNQTYKTLNKKYKPTQSLKISQNKGEKSDAFFPIFLPIYRKFSSQELIAYHYALIFSRNMQQFAQKSYAPLVLA